MSSTKTKRLVILASGRGSNFEAICRALKSGEIHDAQIVGLIGNKKNSGAFEVAKRYAVPAFLVESAGRAKEAYEAELLSTLRKLKPDLVCLAGYMKLLGSALIREYEGRMINIHPSLLPAFPGLAAQRQALEAGVKRTGCTVHWVTEEMDSGPIIEQASLEVLPADTVESLSERLLKLEHVTYVRALKKILAK